MSFVVTKNGIENTDSKLNIYPFKDIFKDIFKVIYYTNTDILKCVDTIKLIMLQELQDRINNEKN
jgi:hypothetical protein